MSKLVSEEEWFCERCTVMHANGDGCDCGDAHEARVLAGFDRIADEGMHVASNSAYDEDGEDTGEGEMSFSWRSCDCCGSRLGGSRYRHALFLTEPAPIVDEDGQGDVERTTE